MFKCANVCSSVARKSLVLQSSQAFPPDVRYSISELRNTFTFKFLFNLSMFQILNSFYNPWQLWGTFFLCIPDIVGTHSTVPCAIPRLDGLD